MTEACCCRPYDAETNSVQRCIARALDLGHCRPGECGCVANQQTTSSSKIHSEGGADRA